MLLWSLGVPLPCGAVRSCKNVECVVVVDWSWNFPRIRRVLHAWPAAKIVVFSLDLEDERALTAASSHSQELVPLQENTWKLAAANIDRRSLVVKSAWEMWISVTTNTYLESSHHATCTESYVEWRNSVWKDWSLLQRGKGGITILATGGLRLTFDILHLDI